MGRMLVRVRDRQTGKRVDLQIEASGSKEARQIAMRDYGHSYEIL